MDGTKIEWTDATWNPTRGCSRVSPGCENCYAEKVAARFSGEGMPYHGLVKKRRNGLPQWNGQIALIHDHLDDPLRWQRPRRVFVNSMSDLFHERIAESDLRLLFSIMATAHALNGHIFQVLTKRPRRMLEFCSRLRWRCGIGQLLRCGPDGDKPRTHMLTHLALFADQEQKALEKGERIGVSLSHQGAPPGVWLGVSVENQATADERIDLLLRTPVEFNEARGSSSGIRFISLEPQLEDVKLERFLKWTLVANDGRRLQHPDPEIPSLGGSWETGLDWVIVGGESGPGARPFDIRWAQRTVEACAKHKVPCFVKQLGSQPHDSMRSIVGGWCPGDPEPDTRIKLKDKKGGTMREWPKELRVRDFPKVREA